MPTTSDRMEKSIMVTFIRLAALLLLLGASPQSPLGRMGVGVGVVEGQANCKATFLTQVLQCASNSSLNPQHFLWLTRDGQMGTQPPDIPAFTQQACLSEGDVSPCFKRVSDQYQTLLACSDPDKNTIQVFYKNVVRTLDSKCADPCRQELVPSLAQCFTSAEVNATLFLSNITLPRHQMLGSNLDDVDSFCTKREEILECMKMKTSMCSESSDILMSAGLDVEALNNTLALLCDNRHLYLHGARCSENRSQEEQQCQSTLLQELSDLETRFQDLSINRSMYAQNLCRVRLDHIRCDLNFLSRRQEDIKCPDEVIGLRREQECTLLPADCKNTFQDRVLDMCEPMRFMLEKRKMFVQSARQKSAALKNVSALYLVVMMLVVCFITAFYH